MTMGVAAGNRFLDGSFKICSLLLLVGLQADYEFGSYSPSYKYF